MACDRGVTDVSGKMDVRVLCCRDGPLIGDIQFWSDPCEREMIFVEYLRDDLLGVRQVEIIHMDFDVDKGLP